MKTTHWNLYFWILIQFLKLIKVLALLKNVTIVQNFTWVRTGLFTTLDYFVLVCSHLYNIPSWPNSVLFRKLRFYAYLLLFGKGMFLKSISNFKHNDRFFWPYFVNPLAYFFVVKNPLSECLTPLCKGMRTQQFPLTIFHNLYFSYLGSTYCR